MVHIHAGCALVLSLVVVRGIQPCIATSSVARSFEDVLFLIRDRVFDSMYVYYDKPLHNVASTNSRYLAAQERVVSPPLSSRVPFEVAYFA